MEEAVAEEVGGRLVAGEEQQDAVRDHLVAGETIALVLRCEHEGHQILAR